MTPPMQIALTVLAASIIVILVLALVLYRTPFVRRRYDRQRAVNRMVDEYEKRPDK